MQKSAVLEEYLGVTEISGNLTSVIRGRTGPGKGSCFPHDSSKSATGGGGVELHNNM